MSLNFSPGACVINPLTNRPIRVNKRAYKDLVRDFRRFERDPKNLEQTLSKRERKIYNPRSKTAVERQKRFWRFVEKKKGVPMRLPGQSKATPIPLKVTEQQEVPQAFVLPIPRGSRSPRASLQSKSPRASLQSRSPRDPLQSKSPRASLRSPRLSATPRPSSSPKRNSIYDRFAKVFATLFSKYNSSRIEISELTKADIPAVRKLCNRDGCFRLTEDEVKEYLDASEWHIKVSSFDRMIGIVIGSPHWKPKFSRGYNSLVLRKSGTEAEMTLNKDLAKYADLVLLCAESGSGVGRAMLKTFEQLAKEEGARNIAIDVGGTCDEELLNKFYKRVYPRLTEYDTYEIGKGKEEKPYTGPGGSTEMINLFVAKFT